MAKKSYKLGVIRSIVRDFPGRKFILVGDSGEQDPEIYADIMREFPGRVLHVFIRDAGADPDRFTNLFGSGPFTLIRDGKDIANFKF